MAVESWNRDPPPGFAGLNPEKPITFYYRNLPHWRQDGATHFVTFRLADSLPQSKLRELDAIRQDWFRRHLQVNGGSSNCQFEAAHGTKPLFGTKPLYGSNWQFELQRCPEQLQKPMWEQLAELLMRKYESMLDEGLGECVLRQSPLRKILTDSLLHFESQQYELGSFVIMPNHVHSIIRPLDPAHESLERVLQSRKQFSAREINLVLGTAGQFWQHESFDRIIRDEEHLYRCIQYIARNPKMAGLRSDEYELWINPRWQQTGWDFDE